MDRLLQKLRQNMAELSVQGDDFTRQIWHMYATFEEFIDTHTSFGKLAESEEKPKPAGSIRAKKDDVVGAAPRPRPRTSSSRHRSKPGARQVIGGSALELAVPNRELVAPAPAAAATEFNFETTSKLGNSKDDMSLVYRRPQHHRCRYRRSRKRMETANPLLETISAIQDPCESDDHDFGGAGPQYYGIRDHRLPGSRFCSDVDKDSIGYAGSNSIDSGYKSSCPTPEPTDAMLYGNEPGSKRNSVASQGSQQSQKPRIAMGTKVMNSLNRHSHPQYAGRDLDHLMYLRQSILSAMQRYEQQAANSSPSPGFRPRSSSASSPGYRSASPGPSSGGPGSSPLPQRRPHMASYPSSRTHSPSYSSASNGSGKSSPGFHRSRFVTAEEDIDALLYGRMEDIPCSYVAMIEDKYRRSSVARVKKLREKNRGGLAAPESSSSSESSCTSPTASNSQSGRFSEVAKCMLEIIEDLQNQTQLPGLVQPRSNPVSPPAPAPSVPETGPCPTSPSLPFRAVDVNTLATGPTRAGLWGNVGPEVSPSLVPRPGSGIVPGPDYHVYEEIMYELTTRPISNPGPPPLPARPDGIFRTSTTLKKVPASHPPPQSHRPKQRSNLYSLFREPSARRDISQSLEQEYLGAASTLGGIASVSQFGQPRHVLGARTHSEQDQVKQSEEGEYGFRIGT